MSRLVTCIQSQLICALLFLMCRAAKAGDGEKHSFSQRTNMDPVLLDREKRQLLFPNTTMLQLQIGVTVPSPAKDIKCNLAFTTNFQLPWNRTQIPTDIFLANSGYDGDSRVIRAKRGIEYEKEYVEHHPNLFDDDTVVAGINTGGNGEVLGADLYGVYNSESRLLHLYQAVEKMLESFGYEGSPCVLQTLCQLAQEPLHSDHDEDLLHELATFILDPSNEPYDIDGEEEDLNPYLTAFARGRAFQDCTAHYGGCSINVVDMFTYSLDN